MCRHRNHGFSAVRSVTSLRRRSLRECAVIETMAAPYVALPTAPAGSPRECAVIETMASAPYVALLPTAPAGSPRECAVIETMASAPYVALLSAAPAGSLRECRHRNHGFSAVRSVTSNCAGGWST
ncbi:hypothetical protein EVAR_91179_1 [Eumeta japonica]|uniref:Uncharacterized protein n=1 Tax=Eumeta variegata TaxID=151549 RepID=A0A4C1ZKC4_EUMVA|nr:hypothetical protein EVAR_91179_1 [Eumeta japonica]